MFEEVNTLGEGGGLLNFCRGYALGTWYLLMIEAKDFLPLGRKEIKLFFSIGWILLACYS